MVSVINKKLFHQEKVPNDLSSVLSLNFLWEVDNMNYVIVIIQHGDLRANQLVVVLVLFLHTCNR
jgi:hypothetical protein